MMRAKRANERKKFEDPLNIACGIPEMYFDNTQAEACDMVIVTESDFHAQGGRHALSRTEVWQPCLSEMQNQDPEFDATSHL
jgi:hypothetical protein